MNELPYFRARRQKSGQIFYYYDPITKPRRETPLGSNYEQALAKYRLLSGSLDNYKIQPQSFYLYRHYDQDGILLYVGVSLSALNRLERHRESSAWFWNISRVDIEKFATRKDSLEAERTAIQTEHPLFNLRMAHPKMEKISKRLRNFEGKDRSAPIEEAKMIAKNPQPA